MRSAIAKACTVLEVTSFVEDLDRYACADGDDALGAVLGAAARIWFRRFSFAREFLVPEVVSPISDNFRAFDGASRSFAQLVRLTEADGGSAAQGYSLGAEGLS